MKTAKIILVAILAMFVITKINAQTGLKVNAKKTETIKVSGNCGMCKERIETAAKLNGVTKADWDKTTKILTLVYDPSLVKTEDIQKKIAAVGHDTGKYKTDDKIYSSLPGCCKYR
jgi:mercuric ion binding protein